MNKFQNIFLHFMNYDTQAIFGLRSHYTKQRSEQQLIMACFVATLLASDYCFLPIGFGYESDLSRRILVKLKCFRHDGLIRYAFREQDIVAYISKKMEGYAEYRHLPSYNRFFAKSPEKLYVKVAAPLIDRDTKVGLFCVEQWQQNAVEALSDDWKKIYESLPDDALRSRLLQIISTFQDAYRSLPFIWPSVLKKLDGFPKQAIQSVRILFEKYYYLAYIQEFNSTILFDLPFATTAFALGQQRCATNSFLTYFNYLCAVGLRDFLYQAVEAPEAILTLRYNPNMALLKDNYRQCAEQFTEDRLPFGLADSLSTEPNREYCKALRCSLLSTNGTIISGTSIHHAVGEPDAGNPTVAYSAKGQEMAEVKRTSSTPKSSKLKKQFLELEHRYGKYGLVISWSCVALGAVLSIAGAVGNTNWTAQFLGLHSNISDAGPGVVLFIVGLFFALITRPKSRLKDVKD